MSSSHDHDAKPHGVMAEFATMSDLVHAIKSAKKAGYTKLDAFTPIPSHEVIHALDIKPSPLPWMCFGAGLTGASLGFALQYITSVHVYPTNIGGRPLNSWVYFIPITFESTVLLATLTAVFGMILLNGLPMPYHPVFNVERFKFASRDRCFLLVTADDPKFDRNAVFDLFEGLEASHVSDVPA